MSDIKIVHRNVIEQLSKTGGQRAQVATCILSASAGKPVAPLADVLKHAEKLVVTAKQTPSYIVQYYACEMRKHGVIEGGFMDGARGQRSQVASIYASVSGYSADEQLKRK